MKIKDLFDLMQSAGLTRSQMEFSSVWLGRSPRYYSHLVATGREPGLATLCGILLRLQRMRLQRYPALLDYKHKLDNEIARRAITDRKRMRKTI